MIAAIVAVTIAFAAPASAAPGALDPSFSDDGVVVTRFFESFGVATDVATQSDGKIVVTGAMHRNDSIDSDFALVRYTRGGRLDRTFSGNGKVRTDFGGRFDEALAVAIGADGAIVVVGRSLDSVAVARYLSDGRLDRSFSGDGRARFPGVGLFGGNDVALQPDGRIVVVGSNGEELVVLRLRPNGVPDDAFGSEGVVRTDVGVSHDAAHAVVITGSGRIVVGGEANIDPARSSDFVVAKYRSGGSLDRTFDGDGIVTADFDSYEDSVNDLVLTGGGGVIAVGQASEAPGGADQSSDVGLMRFAPDGTPVSTFGTDGQVVVDFGSYFDNSHGAAMLDDGSIALASHLESPTGATAAVARVDARTGELDPAFGDGGIADTGAPVSGDDVGGLAVDTEGRIVTATGAAFELPSADFGFLVARLLTA